jgi:hypothetical protein
MGSKAQEIELSDFGKSGNSSDISLEEIGKLVESTKTTSNQSGNTGIASTITGKDYSSNSSSSNDSTLTLFSSVSFTIVCILIIILIIVLIVWLTGKNSNTNVDQRLPTVDNKININSNSNIISNPNTESNTDTSTDTVTTTCKNGVCVIESCKGSVCQKTTKNNNETFDNVIFSDRNKKHEDNHNKMLY